MAGGFLGFARTPLPSGGPPGHSGTAALLRVAAWVLLVAVGLGLLVAVPLSLFIWWGTLAFGDQGDLARVPIVAGLPPPASPSSPAPSSCPSRRRWRWSPSPAGPTSPGRSGAPARSRWRGPWRRSSWPRR